jgi:N-acetylglutamate synthase
MPTARYVVRITPGDVGKRVTVRSRIAGRPGQPGATDTVGILRAWQGGALDIEQRDGTIRTIAERDLLAAKVVDPPSTPAR